jgi:tRNA(Ile)-lysidine synthase
LGGLLEKFVASASPEMWRDVHVGVALSGGPDSVALLRAGVELKRQAGGRGEVFALHVNHKLRGAESDADAAWCGELCRQLGVSLQISDGNVTARAAADGDGIEAAARAERYRLLTEMAEASGSRYLFFGHNRDDQVETVLFRILRGTGIRGLAGISPSRPLTPSLTLLRPLLGCSREEVLRYLAECGQEYRVDSSNADRVFTRNRIRAELLPLLRAEYNAGVDEALIRLAVQAGELQALVETQAKHVLDTSREWQTAVGFALNTATLREHSALLISEVLRLAWREAGFPEQAMTRQWWTVLANLTREGASDVVLNLPENVRVELVRGEVLTFERGSNDPGNAIPGL